tara:strand:+ start:166 stop:825 length:660 start_codon:yes stop_codon:yes gene_type:complete
MKLIVLAAGDSFAIDGFNKLMIREPKSRKTILELYQEIFDVSAIEIVVGYKALELMNTYPEFTYHYNKNWQTTGNAFSLSLALTEEPCYVISSDFILHHSVADYMQKNDNFVILREIENRNLATLNARVKNEFLDDVYRGRSENNDPELTGLFKITDPGILLEWKSKCLSNPDCLAGECLPFNDFKIPVNYIPSELIAEINVPEDYIRLIMKSGLEDEK